MLVMLSGNPSDLPKAINLCVQAANTVKNDHDLRVSFLQIGCLLPIVMDIVSQVLGLRLLTCAPPGTHWMPPRLYTGIGP